MNKDFWVEFLKSAGLSDVGSMDIFLQGQPFEGEHYTSVRQLADKFSPEGVELPVPAGTLVEFQGRLGAVLSYEDPPAPRAQGVVVAVKTANGVTTEHNGSVFVEWDDGKVRAINAGHLKLRQGTQRRATAPSRIRVASLGDLTDFMKVAENTLIHKSTQDLWSLHQDGGGYVIERLFDSSGEPIKS